MAAWSSGQCGCTKWWPHVPAPYWLSVCQYLQYQWYIVPLWPSVTYVLLTPVTICIHHHLCLCHKHPGNSKSPRHRWQQLGSILPDTVSNIDTTQAELCSPPGQHQLQVLVLSSLSLVLTYIFTFLSRRQVGGHRQATTDVKLGETVHQSLSLPPTWQEWFLSFYNVDVLITLYIAVFLCSSENTIEIRKSDSKIRIFKWRSTQITKIWIWKIALAHPAI